MSESAFAVYAKKSKKSKKNRRSKSLTNGHSATSEVTSIFNDATRHVVSVSKTTADLQQTSSTSTIKKRKKNPELDNGTTESIPKDDFLPSPSLQKKKKPKLDKKVTSIQKVIQQATNSCLSAGEKGHKLFEWLLYPLKPSQFFETNWESQPVHITRKTPDYYTPILTSADIDIMLREHPLHFGRNVDIVMYSDGVKEILSPEGRAKPSIVWDSYTKGCSVRILNPQTYNNTVHFILATLQEYFGTMVGANVYLTPAGSQGFAPHYDDIEAFIVQLEGKKHWKLYKPLTDAENLTRFSSKDFARDQLGDLILECELSAGDILYFPRGFVHEAKTDADQHSLHITISTYQRTCYADLMEHLVPQALKMAACNDIDFRKGLPVNYLKHVGLTNSSKGTPERVEIFKTVQKLFAKMASHVDLDDCADILGRKFMHEALPPVLEIVEQQCSSLYDGERIENGQIVDRVELTMETEICLCRYYACRLVKNTDSEGAVLYFSTQNARVYHGEEEQFIIVPDMELGSIIEILQLQYPLFIKIGNLPVEDKQKGLDFVMELWDYGIVMTKTALVHN